MRRPINSLLQTSQSHTPTLLQVQIIDLKLPYIVTLLHNNPFQRCTLHIQAQFNSSRHWE